MGGARTMSITIQGITKEDTGYDKHITFKREGVEYEVLLHWDSYDGYNLSFLNEVTPDWVDEWDEDGHDNQTVASVLDELTDEAIEASYL
jgi:hypothetical protein